MVKQAGAFIHITGIVQGVGFRPFVFNLATRYELLGWVRNTSNGVEIRVDGAPSQLDEFIRDLSLEAPPLSRIDSLEWEGRAPDGFERFEIVHSERIESAFQPVSPDMSICPDCLRELFDPADRRYRYPFINCTNCGPRFTIIEDLPYDRPLTTMADFPLCAGCAVEYEDPRDRRFHAQPVACPDCGPQIWFELALNEIQTSQDEIPSSGDIWKGESGLEQAQAYLAEGKIVAVKGLGGFHLACDATNSAAVTVLRERKLRVDKPFAVMMADMETVRRCCLVDPAEQGLLESRQRPIVILRRKPDAPVVPQVAPGQATIGVMLPYTPLHYLLLSDNPENGGRPVPRMLVMTSGNLSEEPIAYTNPAARKQLSWLADAFLMHNRPIRIRCDDSVVRLNGYAGKLGKATFDPETDLLPVRRSRGYAPYPVRLAWELPPILGAGAEFKNTFCVTRDRYAFLSQHVGDMENFETLQSFEASVEHFEKLFRIHPQALAYDLHPNYLASRYTLARAKREQLPAIGIQHHHAHIVSCLAENSLAADEPVIGVAFDGTGYGDDGAIWGGEFLLSDYQGYRRMAHLRYLPLVGGDLAVREPWRLALAYLHQLGVDWAPELLSVKFGQQALAGYPGGLDLLVNQIERGVNAPLTSSMGRLFDAVAALTGVRQTVNYEAQAAIELEALAGNGERGEAIDPYPFDIHYLTGKESPAVIDPAPLFSRIVADLCAGRSAASISAGFHQGIARMVLEVSRMIRNETGCLFVALSGGVWQNVTLLGLTTRLLTGDGFTVFTHSKVPPNDGGLALGQALAAYHILYNQGEGRARMGSRNL